MLVYDTAHFAVVMLDDSNRSDPEYNYGVLNKEFNVFDVQTASEVAAIMLCDQHNFSKEERKSREKNEAEKVDRKLTLVDFKPEGFH